MRRLNTAKTLRFALATLLLGMGIGFLISGGLERLEEDSNDGTASGTDIEPAKHGEAQGWLVVVHGLRCSLDVGANA